MKVYYKRIWLEWWAVWKLRELLTDNEWRAEEWHLQLSLKDGQDGDTVTSDGRLFQTRTEAAPKVRSLTVTRHVGGMFSSSLEVERSHHRESMSATRRSSRARYGRAMPCKEQKASTASLNSIRCDTRNQWRSWSSGVMCVAFAHCGRVWTWRVLFYLPVRSLETVFGQFIPHGT